MKVGLFDHTELIIDKKNKVLIHRESGYCSGFEKICDEKETLKNFAIAIDNLEIKVGLWLIEKM
ncbi:MAG TPA: hypothetical protein VIK72_19565 [Clostridiaceae bacterium]